MPRWSYCFKHMPQTHKLQFLQGSTVQCPQGSIMCLGELKGATRPTNWQQGCAITTSQGTALHSFLTLRHPTRTCPSRVVFNLNSTYMPFPHLSLPKFPQQWLIVLLGGSWMIHPQNKRLTYSVWRLACKYSSVRVQDDVQQRFSLARLAPDKRGFKFSIRPPTFSSAYQCIIDEHLTCGTIYGW